VGHAHAAGGKPKETQMEEKTIVSFNQNRGFRMSRETPMARAAKDATGQAERKPIIIKIENANPFDAGWHACHFGLPINCVDALELSDNERAYFNEGFQMRQETADMDDSRDATGHGGAHIAFLVQATNEFPSITWARSRVSITRKPPSVEPKRPKSDADSL
jgi:hypothetical protein